MTLLGFAFANLRRRPARSLLTILGISLAIGTAVALMALGRGITDSVGRGLNERGAELVVGQRNATDIGSARLPEAMGRDIAALPGVAGVNPELFGFALAEGGRQVLVAGWSPGALAWDRMPLAAGRLPRAGQREVVLGDTLAESLGARVGSRIEMYEEPFEVVGISRYGTALNRGLAVMPLDVMQDGAMRHGVVTGFWVRVAPGADRARLRAGIEAALPVRVFEPQEMLEGDRNVTVLRAVSSAVSSIALVMGALNLFGTLLMSVQERTREIGMIAAMGWTDGRIVALIMIEGLVLGVFGCLGGVAVGLLASSAFGSLPAIGAVISFTPTASDLALPLLLALPLCAVGAAYPAWRAVRMLPADALRRA